MPSPLSRSSIDPSTSLPEATEAPPPTAPPARPMQVGRWTPEPGAQQPPASAADAGGLPASQLARGLTARTVLPEVDALLTSRLPASLGVTEGDASAALGLIAALPAEAQREVLLALGRDRRLGVLAERLPQEGRAQLLEVAVGSGVVSERPGELAPARVPQPPDRPALLDNASTLPGALRELVHAENQRRAQGYEQRFSRYVASYCQAVQQAPTPLALRALGPLSSPPSLLEPGITAEDQRLRGWPSALLGAGLGASQAARAVSDRVSDFRGEVHAGGFSLGADTSAKLGLGPVAQGATIGVAASDDGRLASTRARIKRELEVGAGPVAVGAEFSPEGRMETLKGGVEAHGLELTRGGKLTFNTRLEGATVGSFADPAEGTAGASVGVSQSVAIVGKLKLGVSVKVSLTAQGIKREYYQDIGGRQGGVFGPMPELEAGLAWRALPEERRQWYARQGFTEKHWPGTPE